MVTQTRSHEGVTYGHMRGNYILLSTLLIAGCDARQTASVPVDFSHS